jgi:hypothetical protein
MRESETYKSIVDYLRGRKCLVFRHRDLGIRKQDGSYIPFLDGEKGGICDIIACLPTGQFLAIKIRRKRKKPTIGQGEFMKSVMKHDGIGIFAHCVEDVRKVL